MDTETVFASIPCLPCLWLFLGVGLSFLYVIYFDQEIVKALQDHQSLPMCQRVFGNDAFALSTSHMSRIVGHVKRSRRTFAAPPKAWWPMCAASCAALVPWLDSASAFEMWACPGAGEDDGEDPST